MNVLVPKLPTFIAPTERPRPWLFTSYSAWLIAAAVLPLFVWYVRRLNDGSDEWQLKVRERIVSEANTEAWTDCSAWYWDALLHPLNGPWRAETVIEVK